METVDNHGPHPKTSLSLFLLFLKAGGLTLGDGYATIAPVKRALVAEEKWLDEEDFSHYLATVHAMPGIFNVNFAAYMGFRLLKWQGCVAALAGMLLPPFVVVCLLASFIGHWRESEAWAGFFRGVRPAVVALIVLPCLQMLRSTRFTLSTVWIPVGAALAIAFWGVSPSLIIAALVVSGLLYGVFVYTGS